ncbi:MAG: PaaI family thioesterase [Candidatus Methylomirabilales bacterium]
MEFENDDRCFVCGSRNAQGLRLRFELVGVGEIRTVFTPAKRFQGFKGVVHGGILATVLDEVMVNAVWLRGRAAVTGKLEVRLKQPARVGETLEVRGRILKESGRTIEAESQVLRRDGTVIAEGRGVLVKV